MRTGRVPLAALLLVLAVPVLQVSCTNDLYWEGEEYGSNEFLEVKPEESTALDSHKRHKRQWDWSSLWSSVDEPEADTATTPPVPDDPSGYDKDDADLDVGSGIPDKSESEPKEKTLRVTFTVMEPYSTAYSNRDSPEFLNISRSLANAVDLLFESLPGTQRSSLVRIQSLVNDDFLCKVTLDIVTTRNEDTDTIKDILRNHIKNNGRLGETAVRDGDFSAQLIDPGTTFDCDVTEFSCDEDFCLPLSLKCNGREDCRDGTDESDCPVPDTTNESPTTETTTVDYNSNVDVNNEPTPDYRNYDQTPDNNYNQSLERPYEQGPDRQNPYDQNAGRDSNPYPYDPNVYRDITVLSGENPRPDNRNPYDQSSNPDNRNPYDQSSNPDNRNPYDQSSNPDNRNPYDQSSNPDNRNPYDQSSNPDNRNPYDQSSNPDNRNPYDQSSNPDNRNPYDQSSSPDNWGSIYGQSTRPDNQNPNQGGNPEDPRENPDNRNPAAGTSEAPPREPYPRGDLGGANDPYSTDSPDEPETVTGTSYADDITTTRTYNDCPPNYLRCDDTRCVEQTRRCDGRNDCYDESDEANCPSRKYKIL